MSLAVGVQLKVPLRLSPAGVKLPPEGTPAAVREPIGSPSGSEAETATVISVFSSPDAVAGAVATGVWSTSVAVTAVLAEAVKLFVAVNVTLYVPTSLCVGDHVIVPAVLPGSAAKVAPGGRPAAGGGRIASPSGSEAVTFSVSVLPTITPAVGGAVTTGARSTLVTVMSVLEEPLKAFAAVKVTV